MSKRGENIYKRKDGRWEGRYVKSQENGRVKYGYIYSKSYNDVKEKLNYMKSLSALGTVKNVAYDYKNIKLTFKVIASQWLATKASVLKESSYIRYTNLLNSYIYPYFGDMYMENITHKEVDNFINILLNFGGRNSSGLSPKTVQCIVSLFKTILSYASQFYKNMNISADSLTVRRENKMLRVLSVQEQALITDYIYSHLTLSNIGILLCLYTGMRVGEICALTWSNILLEERCIYVEKTLQRLQNKDTSDSKTSIVISAPKSACSIRKIPLPEELYDLLKSNQGEEDTYFLTGTRSYIEPRTLQYRFKSVLRKCNITDAKFHSLRHTFATRCIELGFDIKSLSEILGHANVNITLNRYVHPSMEQKQKNMNLLTELLAVK